MKWLFGFMRATGLILTIKKMDIEDGGSDATIRMPTVVIPHKIRTMPNNKLSSCSCVEMWLLQ